jgi:hypothetical protein
MTGGLIQLVAKGIPDIYLTGDPQITFFKVLYRRHTNFSIESTVQNFGSMVDFGETVSCTISKSGDLVGKIFLYIEIPSLPKFINMENGEEDRIKKIAWISNLGYALVKEISIEIGDQQIDKQYGEWLYIWSQVSGSHDHALDKMIGNVPSLFNFSNGKPGYGLYVPLEFWFCKNIGLALPLVALASVDVKLTVTFRRLEECYRIGPTHSIEIEEEMVPFQVGDYIKQTINNQTIYGFVMGHDFRKKKLYYIKIQSPTASKKIFEAPSNDDIIKYRIYHTTKHIYCTPKIGSRETNEMVSLPYRPRIVNSFLFVDYIYLDREERIKFSKSSHEYLIEQIQFNQVISINSTIVKQKLALSNPCKAHYWVIQLDMLVTPGSINELFNYTTPHLYQDIDLLESAKLLLNGHDRFSERGREYFNWIVPYQYHHRGPSTGIYVYSFSLHPEIFQPSSTTNMSKIDDIYMQMHLNGIIGPYNTARIRSYTISYNILRVFSHTAGLYW